MAENNSQTRKGKNVIIFCDGTGNKFIDVLDPDNSNSNVVKLYTTLRIDNDHVAYYHPGVGTADDPSAKGWLARKWSVLIGLAFAWGFKDNVLDAYRYLMETYDDGDHVYMFGFSRGAYTVRALAGLLQGYGLLCRGNEGHLPYAWNEYVKQHDDGDKHLIEPNEKFKETFSRKGFRIRFMGLWDTVSSVGWINTPLRLFSVARNPLIDIGRHAVSIDERRCFYRDNLWIGADESKLTQASVATEKAISAAGPSQDLLQIWFAGVHSDIGGSYPQKESVLSNIALKWLLDEADKAFEADTELNPDRHRPAVISQLKSLVLGKDDRPTGTPGLDKKIEILCDLYPVPTESIVHRSLKSLWWFLEVLPHRYYDKDEGEENWRTPLGMRRRIPEGSYIHHSVKERIDKEHFKYRPKNLLGGKDALQPTEVPGKQIPGQDPGTVYLYKPIGDSQPLMNRAAIRIGVMVLVSALDLAAVALLPVVGWYLWHRSRR